LQGFNKQHTDISTTFSRCSSFWNVEFYHGFVF